MKKNIIFHMNMGTLLQTVFIETGNSVNIKTMPLNELPACIKAHPGYTVHMFGDEEFLKKIEKDFKETNANYDKMDIRFIYNR